MYVFFIGSLINLKIYLKDCNEKSIDTEFVSLTIKGEKSSLYKIIPLTRLEPGIYKASINTEQLGVDNYDFHVQARGSYQAAHTGKFTIYNSPAYLK